MRDRTFEVPDARLECLVANDRAADHLGAYGDRPAVYSRTQPDSTGIVGERPCDVSASWSPVRETWVTA